MSSSENLTREVERWRAIDWRKGETFGFPVDVVAASDYDALAAELAAVKAENAELKQRWVATQEANAIRDIIMSPSNADLNALDVVLRKNGTQLARVFTHAVLKAVAVRASAEEAT
jgi:hypothetical protein